MQYNDNFLGAIQKSAPFNTPTFMKLTITQRHYVKILCPKFHPNRSRNMGRGAEIHLRPQIISDDNPHLFSRSLC
jgi:hypothetical protein